MYIDPSDKVPIPEAEMPEDEASMNFFQLAHMAGFFVDYHPNGGL